jgi:preprotein translocase subunit YajC
MTARTAEQSRAQHSRSASRRRRSARSTPDDKQAEKGLSLLGRLGLAARTGFYLILVGLTIRIAVLGGSSGRQANAHGALALVSRPLIGKIAIGAVALGFVLFGAGRLMGSYRDDSVSALRRAMTALQGIFYLVLAYVPASYLAGRQQSGSQEQQQQTTADLLRLPGGQAIVVIGGVAVILVCAEQIRGALSRDFRDGLDMGGSPDLIKRVAEFAGVVGITARALVFLPVGVFLIVSAALYEPRKSYGTDAELLRLSGRPWGVALLAVICAGLTVFVVFSAIETRYRRVVSAR